MKDEEFVGAAPAQATARDVLESDMRLPVRIDVYRDSLNESVLPACGMLEGVKPPSVPVYAASLPGVTFTIMAVRCVGFDTARPDLISPARH
ncbi:hypothetical protein ACMA1D_18175 [Streptomyces sp. 796.1]|uniref:hypothetical protein n=1 Tax=Streptomyces sp. 796.1 TaxID=3163029 RepID=UPI0039C8D879